MAAIAGGQRRGMAMGRRKPNARWDVLSAMLVFLDFEASSLGKRSYPIEVGWVFEDGRSEAHLIRPAPEWTDWDAQAEAVHHIPRDLLLREGAPHDVVAQRMIEALEGHDLLASAPSVGRARRPSAMAASLVRPPSPPPSTAPAEEDEEGGEAREEAPAPAETAGGDEQAPTAEDVASSDEQAAGEGYAERSPAPEEAPEAASHEPAAAPPQTTPSVVPDDEATAEEADKAPASDGSSDGWSEEEDEREEQMKLALHVGQVLQTAGGADEACSARRASAANEYEGATMCVCVYIDRTGDAHRDRSPARAMPHTQQRPRRHHGNHAHA